jgi:soluble lytic murein transglycosylase
VARSSARSRAESRVRRRRRPTRRRFRSGGRKRRIGVAVVARIVGLGSALLIFRGDVEDTIRSVTLPLKHEDVIRQQAQEKDVPADLIAAVIYAESRFRDQTSSAGARGLMQITPQTAQIIEDKSGGSTFTLQDLSNPDLNIRYGTFYLKYLLDRFDGNEVAAIAAYNAGETVVETWGGASLTESDIKFSETRGYVDDVLAKRDDYRRSYRSELGL